MKYGSWHYPPMNGHVQVHVDVHVRARTHTHTYRHCLQALEHSQSQVETHQSLTGDFVKIIP